MIDRRLDAARRPLAFVQSGGCCDHSPICLKDREPHTLIGAGCGRAQLPRLTPGIVSCATLTTHDPEPNLERPTQADDIPQERAAPWPPHQSPSPRIQRLHPPRTVPRSSPTQAASQPSPPSRCQSSVPDRCTSNRGIGLAHTDIHAANGDWPVKPSPPFIPGHEGVGIVTELAAGKAPVGDLTHKVSVGDRVAMPWLGYACGNCNYCVSGWETLCHEQENMGYSIDGGFGEYADRVCPVRRQGSRWRRLVRRRTADLCRRDHLRSGQGCRPPLSDLVAVFGVGGLGHLAIQYAAIAGGRVIAVDVIDEKLDLARELGAEFTINAHEGRPSRGDPAARRRRPGDRIGRLAACVRAGVLGRCVAVARSCSSRCRPTTRSRFRSSRPCSTGSRSSARSSGHERTCARSSSCTHAGKTRVIRETRPLDPSQRGDRRRRGRSSRCADRSRALNDATGEFVNPPDGRASSRASGRRLRLDIHRHGQANTLD